LELVVSHDLIITDRDGVTHGYVVAVGEQNPVVHTKSAPTSLPTSTTSQGQAGGIYDVRDAEGDKAIAHLSWHLGAGQESLDVEDATPYRYRRSKNMDISVPGRLRLLPKSESVAADNCSGPCFSALGYIWRGDSIGRLYYSANNGTTWSTATIGIGGGQSISGPISGFATDGGRLFFCVATGAHVGIWANTAGTVGTFAPFGSSPTGEAVRHIACQGGGLWATTAAGVGSVNTTTGAWTLRSTVTLNATNTSIALIAAGNAVYWVTSSGGQTFVYKVYLSPPSTYVTEQFAEFPTDFVATSAVGYLSTIYVAGYWKSTYAGVGRGAIYAASESEVYPLLNLGEQPENTDDPQAAANDNRIYAICSGSKDLFFITNTAIYRWDIDGGGYSHYMDHLGTGSGELVRTWNPGSNYSWDGTDLTVVTPPHAAYPSGWTLAYPATADIWDKTLATAAAPGDTTFVYNHLASPKTLTFTTEYDWSYSGANKTLSVYGFTHINGGANSTIATTHIDSTMVSPGHWTTVVYLSVAWTADLAPYRAGAYVWQSITVSLSAPVWAISGGHAGISATTTYDGSGFPNSKEATLTGTPAGDEALDNAVGTFFRVLSPAVTSSAGSFYCTVDDGTKCSRFYVENTYKIVGGLPVTIRKAHLQKWESSAWSDAGVIELTADAIVIILHLIGNVAVLYAGNGTAIDDPMRSSLDTTLLKPSASSSIVLDLAAGFEIDDIVLNSVGPQSTAVTAETLFHPSVSYCNGYVFSPYAVAANNVSLTITAISKQNPCRITTSAIHGLENGQVVNIAGSNSTTSVDGNWVVTDISDYVFSIAKDMTASTNPGTTGTVTANDNTGYVHMTSGFATIGSLEQSRTTFHTGSILKDYRKLRVSHDPLPAGAALTAQWEIDGVGGSTLGTTTGGVTEFPINQQGYGIATILGVTLDASTGYTPVIRAINVEWDFVKTKQHQYLLDCRTGAGGGRWDEDPEEAISFLFSTADEQATFEDRFVGTYEGTIRDAQFAQANYSQKEGYGGLVRITVRET
jgi:hypothetical protein